jgi:DedD protein
MRSLLDVEEEEETKAAEITLSTTSLLGIFFGLVLVCGVFFGFGYSMGRGTGHNAHADGLTNVPTITDDTPAPQPPATAAVVEPDPQPAPAVVIAPHKDTTEEADASPAPALPLHTPRPSAGKPMETQPVAVEPPPNPSAQPMVQIAAVARREDADVLVSALRQRGYGVVVRNEPHDNLLHVQVGPFADRNQASAMKQKLLSDGYNAIIKQ